MRGCSPWSSPSLVDVGRVFLESKREKNFAAENKKDVEKLRASGFASAQGIILRSRVLYFSPVLRRVKMFLLLGIHHVVQRTGGTVWIPVCWLRVDCWFG